MLHDRIRFLVAIPIAFCFSFEMSAETYTHFLPTATVPEFDTVKVHVAHFLRCVDHRLTDMGKR